MTPFLRRGRAIGKVRREETADATVRRDCDDDLHPRARRRRREPSRPAWRPVSGEPDPYEILQVRPDAGEDVIRAAYRALARRHHPDTSVDATSVPQMVLVNRAWEILGSPERRSRYDREHGVVARPTTPAPAAHPPATWSAPSGAGGAGSAPSGAGGAGGAGTAAGTSGTASGTGPSGTASGTGSSGTASGTGPSGPGFGGGRPPIQRRGADGRVIEWRRAPDGTGGAGEPPGRPSGTVLPFGRFIAWSIGEIARHDPGYLEWLDQRPDGAPYRDEIDATLKRIGWRQTPASRDKPKRWGR